MAAAVVSQEEEQQVTPPLPVVVAQDGTQQQGVELFDDANDGGQEGRPNMIVPMRQRKAANKIRYAAFGTSQTYGSG